MPEKKKTIQEGLTVSLALPLNVACELSLASKDHYNSFVSQTLEGPCYYDMESDTGGTWNTKANLIVQALDTDGFKELYSSEIEYLSNAIDTLGNIDVQVILLNKFADLPFLHPLQTEFADQLQGAIDVKYEVFDVERSECASLSAKGEMHIANLVTWRIQSECIARALKKRGCKRNSKRLATALKQIDAIWKLDLGATYQHELARAIATHFTEDTSAGR